MKIKSLLSLTFYFLSFVCTFAANPSETENESRVDDANSGNITTEQMVKAVSPNAPDWALDVA